MILLVEDNEDDVFIMKRAMKKLPAAYPMNVANSGRDALEYFQGAGKYSDRTAYPIPSLIFLDLKLPFVNGFEVLAWINKQSELKDIPVLILSSSPEERDRERARQLGAKAFLVKPPTPQMLQQALDTFLAHAASPS